MAESHAAGKLFAHGMALLRITPEEDLEESHAAMKFFAHGMCIGLALSFSAAGCTDLLGWYFQLDLHKHVSQHILALALSSTVPIVTYLLYHQLTMPTWLTFGYLVSLGGVKRNICDESTANQWPCFTWFSNITGPGGWKYLFQPDAQLIFFLLLLVFNIIFLELLVTSLRKSKIDDPQRRSNKCTKCEKLRADIEMPELSDARKQ